MINVTSILDKLANARPLFHSESDFQHALAWLIQLTHPEAAIRLEYRHPALPGRCYIDLWVAMDGERTAIELKYKTRALRSTVAAEDFCLLQQGAQDQGRYDFCRDVERIEQIRNNDPATRGVAILLTNDSSYWRPKAAANSIDDQFRLCEGSTLQGELDWLAHASPGTKGGRIRPIRIAGQYQIEWRPYSVVSEQQYGQFRYLLIEAARL